MPLIRKAREYNMTEEGTAARKHAQIVWWRDPEFSPATQAEHAFVEGYELVAFDIPPGAGGAPRAIGWEVWSPKTPALGSPEEYAKRLHELIDDNDAFDELVETLEADRSIKREEMREIASAFLGYTVPKGRARAANLNDIRHRQSSNMTRWVERMKRIGLRPRGLEQGASASFDEAKRAAEATLMKLLERGSSPDLS
jgi:hypothetical protein